MRIVTTLILLAALVLGSAPALAGAVGRNPPGSWNGYVQVPDVVGMCPRTAQAALHCAHLGCVSEVQPGRGSPTVLRQSQKAGSWVKLDTTVTITVRRPNL